MERIRGEQRSFHLQFNASFISPCPRPPLTDSLATAALLGLEMLRLQWGGGMEDVGNSSISLISQISVKCQPTLHLASRRMKVSM